MNGHDVYIKKKDKQIYLKEMNTYNIGQNIII